MKYNHIYLRALTQSSWDYLRKKTICTQLPFRLWLEPTNICNIKCEMCPNPLIPRSQLGKMDFSIYRKIIDEASSFVYEVYLFHRGESLIHTQLPQMIKYAKEKGLLVKLNTNATLLTEEKSWEILESGLDLISFSIDGYEKEVFERIRVGAHFDKVMNNVKNFLLLKKKGEFKRPLTQIEIMEFISYSETDLEEKKSTFFQNFKGLSFDRSVFRKPHNVGGNVELNEDQGYVVRRKRSFPCSFPWYSLTIHWNGNVCPCPRDFTGNLIFGNVSSMSLADIWNNDKMQSLRRDILEKKFDNMMPCKSCDQVYRYQACLAGMPVGYLPTLFKDSPLVYSLWRFLKTKKKS